MLRVHKVGQMYTKCVCGEEGKEEVVRGEGRGAGRGGWCVRVCGGGEGREVEVERGEDWGKTAGVQV